MQKNPCWGNYAKCNNTLFDPCTQKQSCRREYLKTYEPKYISLKENQQLPYAGECKENIPLENGFSGPKVLA
jgi:hypothetical protein